MPINNAINLAYQKEQLDLYAKKIMADDQIIKVLLKNAVSDLFPQQVEITIRNMLISKVPVDPGYTNRISVKQQENFIPSEGRIVFDLLFETQLQSNKTITVNVEIQKNFHLKYPPACREEFYLARQISAQAESIFSLARQEYGKIHHAIGIWLYLNVPKKYSNTIIRCQRERRIMAGSGQQRTDNFPSTIIEIMVGNEPYTGDNDLLHVLHIIFKETCSLEEKMKRLAQFGIIDHNEFRKELRDMCNYSDLIYEKGIRKG
ncbi:MAG: hypothetical protein ACI316_04340, partial [Lactimicrobium massiliense]